MARPPTTSGGRRGRSAAPKKLFRDRTILFHWLLTQLGAESWRDVAQPLAAAEGSGADTSPTLFAQHLRTVCLEGLRAVKDADIMRIDARIVAVTQRLNEHRADEPIRWKYFQYLALFLTELYLDWYLGDRAKLSASLNNYLAGFRGAEGLEIRAYGFDEDDFDDLAKVAFWMATGSGKTLVMHANVVQYLAALERHGKPKPEHILLVTPSAGLSVQHERELRASGIPCARFEKGLRDRDVVTIIEITSLRDKSKEKTVAVAAFESKVGNLVLIDEGHRGSSKEDGEWRRYRQALARNGFAFEYSATFAQAAAKDKAIEVEYAKCILIDYSYFRYHEDGYGKHWTIMNINPGAASAQRATQLEGEHLRAYLTGALVVFYQQLETYQAARQLADEHRIERPFCLFAGKSVTGGNEGKDEQSDMTRVLSFLATFVSERHKNETTRILDGILRGNSEFRTRQGRDVFDMGTVLPELQRQVQLEGLTGVGLYRKMLERIFGSTSTGSLHVAELKEADGEIALSVGVAPPFGVVNVGDAAGLRNKVEDERIENVVIDANAFGRSLFHGIDAAGSSLTMLIGAKKFTEGWSSWRVSLMGLLNIGRGQGTQIIQLFGRGVRLRGKGMSLKRTSPKVPKHDDDRKLKVLETLNIFGVRADYMDIFEDELKAEGFDADEQALVETLPVVKLEPRPKLKVLKLPTVAEWKRRGPPVVLSPEPDEVGGLWVEVDANPRVQITGGSGKDKTSVEHVAQGPLDCFHFVKHRELFAELVHAKAIHGWSNLALPRVVTAVVDGTMRDVPLTKALLRGAWYKLRLPKRYVELGGFEHFPLWQQLATELVIRYAEAFWEKAKNRYQTENAKIVGLDEFLNDPELSPSQRAALEEAMFPTEYEVTIPREGDEKMVVDFVRKLAAKVKTGQFDDLSLSQVLVSIGLDGHHLYDPLVHAPTKATLRVKTSPVALNDGEYRFVRDLKAWLATKPAALAGAVVHVLRNPVKRGIGFRDARGFYPDFLIWVQRKNEEWLTFVDPKGLYHLIHEGMEFKVRLWEHLKKIEEKHADLGVHLDAWLLSRTAHNDVLTPKGLSDFKANHIVFQDEQGKYVAELFAGFMGAG